MKKPILYFRNPKDPPIKHKVVSRNPGVIDVVREEEKNYVPMKETFSKSISLFFEGLNHRNSKRNKQIKIPRQIDFIEIEFQNYFKSQDFDALYIRDFGLTPVLYKNFNQTVVFAISDPGKFNMFIKCINDFINSDNPQNDNSLNKNIFYIKEFNFYGSNNRKGYEIEESCYEISFFEYEDFSFSYKAALNDYLYSKEIKYDANEGMSMLTLFDIDISIIEEIRDNFDTVMKVNSADAGIIRPSETNLPIREYGFEVKKSDSLPIIGVIDTGVMNDNPLRDIIISNGEYDMTGTNALIDNINHGTAVACFSALGSKILPDYNGTYETDALILPIKILDPNVSGISPLKVIDLIKRAYNDFGINIFTLAIGYCQYLRYNDNISDYAYLLDKLSYELNILIFISIGNYCKLSDFDRPKEYAKYFIEEETNLCSPADSMNNMIIGSISDNFEKIGDSERFSMLKIFPSSFTRKFNIKFFDKDMKRNIKNPMLRKPDMIIQGGDFNNDIDPGSEYALKLLSNNRNVPFYRQIGTSFSTGLAANIASKVVSQYPGLSNNMQTVKALLINSSVSPKYPKILEGLFNSKDLMRMTVGYGIPDEFYSYYCDENTLTFVLEDEIIPGTITSYPIRLPDYLNDINFKKYLLEFNATLCFSFRPIRNNHLAYCPIHIKFGFFKNMPLEDDEDKEKGINNNKTDNIKINTQSTWSQDYYYGNKFLSNAQKIEHKFKKADIINEDNEFKIVVASKLHKLLSKSELPFYENMAQKFSLVVTIRELPNEDKQLTSRLYDEMILINNLEAINIIEAEAELSNE